MITKREKHKDGYWSVTRDDDGKYLTRHKWHSAPVKGVSSNMIAQRRTEQSIRQKFTRNLPKEEWKQQGYRIPKKVEYANTKQNMAFHYEVRLKYTDQHGNKGLERWVTITNDRPMTQKEINGKARKAYKKDYNIGSIQGVSVQKLTLHSRFEYGVDAVKERGNEMPFSDIPIEDYDYESELEDE